MITASIGEASIASRKAAKSASPYFVGRHIRGLWWKIWIDSQPRSVPRSIPLSNPPAVDTWAPISIGRTLRPTRAGRMGEGRFRHLGAGVNSPKRTFGPALQSGEAQHAQALSGRPIDDARCPLDGGDRRRGDMGGEPRHLVRKRDRDAQQ